MKTNGTLGVVLSGGGARGAYEAGALGFVFERLADPLDLSRLDVFAGTSIGAFNAAFLASRIADPPAAGRELIRAWGDLELGDVLQIDLRRAVDWARILRGGAGELGVFEHSPLHSMIGQAVDRAALDRVFRERRLGALSIAATCVATGEPVVFLERRADVAWTGEPRHNVRVLDAAIDSRHVAASSAIPVLFPPVNIDGRLYADGGLRLNTPIAPAIHLGADRLLIISVASTERVPAPQVAELRTPGLAFLFGKVVNAFMLDHLTHDIDHLDQINELVPARFIERVVIKPSIDIGALAKRYLEDHRGRIDHLLGRTLFALLDVGEERAADLASYLLFDGGFTRALIELGWRDAAATFSREDGCGGLRLDRRSPPCTERNSSRPSPSATPNLTQP